MKNKCWLKGKYKIKKLQNLFLKKENNLIIKKKWVEKFSFPKTGLEKICFFKKNNFFF